MKKIYESIFDVYAGVNPQSVLREMKNGIETVFYLTEEEFREDYESGRKYIVEVRILGYTPIRKKKKTNTTK